MTAARDMNKCSRLVEEITATTNNTNNAITNNNNNNKPQPGTIKCMECDLESFDSMKNFVQTIVKNEPKIDTIINGAGTT